MSPQPFTSYLEEPGGASGEWRVWSDGSSLSNPGAAGWAVYAKQPDGTAFSLHGSSRKRTNNEAELHAFLKALQAIPEGQPAVIYSDSEYSIKAAAEYRPKWEANGMRNSDKKPIANAERITAIWTELDQRPGVRLEWVRGHAGNDGNEAVDTLARSAAEAVRNGGRPVKEVRRDYPASSLSGG